LSTVSIFHEAEDVMEVVVFGGRRWCERTRIRKHI